LNQNTDADKLSIVVAAFVVGGSIHVLRFWGGGWLFVVEKNVRKKKK
jgi:hypothetical protein